MQFVNNKEINSSGSTISSNSKDGATTGNTSRAGSRTTGIRVVDRWGQVKLSINIMNVTLYVT